MKSSAALKKPPGFLGIEACLKRKPRELSGGQRQRVAVGRAIVREPKVFLFDEPLSNLDAKLRVQTRAEISKLHQRLQTTFIYVTHDQTEAMTMATRIAVMNKGLLQQLDTPQNLYDRPANLFVAGFIGSPAMNFFPAKVQKDGGTLFVDTGDFAVKVPEAKIETYTHMRRQRSHFRHSPRKHSQPTICSLPASMLPPVEAKVDVTELMGNEIFLYLLCGKNSFVARVDPRTRFQMGEQVQIVFNMDNFHIFDPSLDAENPPAVR